MRVNCSLLSFIYRVVVFFYIYINVQIYGIFVFSVFVFSSQIVTLKTSTIISLLLLVFHNNILAIWEILNEWNLLKPATKLPNLSIFA